jgi:hypothetical protein
MPTNWDNLEELKRLRNELHIFRSSSLHDEFVSHFKELAENAILEVLETHPTSESALYVRESVLGEARNARQTITFFDDLYSRIDRILTEQ